MDGEDQAAQDARVEKLWKTLDTRNEGQLNLSGLKKGLTKIDHRSSMVQLLESCLTGIVSSKRRRFSPSRCYEGCGHKQRWPH